MSTIIFAVLAFILGCLTVLAPRPVVRTGFLSWFLALVFASLDASMIAGTLAVLAGVLLVIDLLFFREPKPVDDIGGRHTASATVDDATLAKLEEARRTGDWSGLNDLSFKDALALQKAVKAKLVKDPGAFDAPPYGG